MVYANFYIKIILYFPVLLPVSIQYTHRAFGYSLLHDSSSTKKLIKVFKTGVANARNISYWNLQLIRLTEVFLYKTLIQKVMLYVHIGKKKVVGSQLVHQVKYLVMVFNIFI